jgi:hypothetical protein
MCRTRLRSETAWAAWATRMPRGPALSRRADWPWPARRYRTAWVSPDSPPQTVASGTRMQPC